MSHTMPQLVRTLLYVADRAKGLSVGIPVQKADAKKLVQRGWAEYAPPVWNYPKPVTTVRLTTLGALKASTLSISKAA